MTFIEGIEYKTSLIVFKCLRQLGPGYLNEKFQFHTNNNRYLRSGEQNLLKIPKPKLELFRKSLDYSGASIWNKIPKHVRDANSTLQFKHAYLSHWKMVTHTHI